MMRGDVDPGRPTSEACLDPRIRAVQDRAPSPYCDGDGLPLERRIGDGDDGASPFCLLGEHRRLAEYRERSDLVWALGEGIGGQEAEPAVAHGVHVIIVPE